MPGTFGGNLASASPTDFVFTPVYASSLGNNVTHSTEVLSGVLAEDTYSNALVDVTGSGKLKVLYVRSADTTSRTVSIQLTIDGNIVLDGGVVTGVANTGFNALSDPVFFNESFSVKIKTSVVGGETDKLTLGYRYDEVS